MTVGRFIGVIGDMAQVTPQAAHAALSTGLDPFAIEGWGVILHDGSQPVASVGLRGSALIGYIFDQSDSPVDPAKIEHFDSRTDGGDFLQKYWGPFLLLGGSGEVRTVLREPGGAQPCYYFVAAGTVVVTSSPADCARAGLLPIDMDWLSISSFLCSADAPATATGLRGLKEIGAGFRLAVGPDQISCDPVWDPWVSAAQSEQWRGRDSVAALKSRCISCVRALSQVHEPPVLRVSGGLDSSIVAAALRAAGTSALLLNMVARGHGDERDYARELSRTLDQDLIETTYDVSAVDIGKPSAPGLPRPWGRYMGQAARAACRAAAGIPSASIWQGHGGDSLFCALGSTSPLVDQVREEGFGALRLGALLDIARANDATIWEAMGDFTRKFAQPVDRYRFQSDDTFLDDDFREQELEAHPWLDRPPRRHPGKLAHIAYILASIRQIEGYQRLFDGAVVNPLLCRPLIELCLSIPAWWWCASGWDRQQARAAFAGLLPSSIIRRRTKGTPDPFIADIFAIYRSEIRDHLMDGILVRSRVLDGDAINRAFAGPTDAAPPSFRRLLQLADAEAWARSWLDVSLVDRVRC
ncbi:hypothetical protein DMC47_38860 [Nostoc sp. 3335mG]|nr:hypothetical protein DMC47_38860 [Nostoc sp. 3335mG]